MARVLWCNTPESVIVRLSPGDAVDFAYSFVLREMFRNEIVTEAAFLWVEGSYLASREFIFLLST
jgi:hypothetical protein